MVDNKELTFYINTNGAVPNSVDNQANNANATKNGNSIKSMVDDLPLKQMAVVATAKKTVTMAAQRVGLYTGNQVLQRQVSNTISFVEGVAGIGIAFAINPYVGVGMVASQAISYGFELSDYNLNLNRSNTQIYQEQINYNTNLNHNRYAGGAR